MTSSVSVAQNLPNNVVQKQSSLIERRCRKIGPQVTVALFKPQNDKHQKAVFKELVNQIRYEDFNLVITCSTDACPLGKEIQSHFCGKPKTIEKVVKQKGKGNRISKLADNAEVDLEMTFQLKDAIDLEGLRINGCLFLEVYLYWPCRVLNDKDATKKVGFGMIEIERIHLDCPNLIDAGTRKFQEALETEFPRSRKGGQGGGGSCGCVGRANFDAGYVEFDFLDRETLEIKEEISIRQ